MKIHSFKLHSSTFVNKTRIDFDNRAHLSTYLFNIILINLWIVKFAKVWLWLKIINL